MNFGKLLSEGKIKKIKKAFPDFESCEDDLNSSKHSFASKDYEWAATIAYNAVLRAGIKLMAFLGYRAVGKEYHNKIRTFVQEKGTLQKNYLNFSEEVKNEK